MQKNAGKMEHFKKNEIEHLQMDCFQYPLGGVAQQLKKIKKNKVNDDNTYQKVI